MTARPDRNKYDRVLDDEDDGGDTDIDERDGVALDSIGRSPRMG
jgi:hypothetical protein